MRGAWIALLATTLAVPASLAQGPSTAPPVQFPDRTIEERIVPLEGDGRTEVGLAIGCDALETAQWTTSATITPSGPSSASPIVSPRSLSWVTGPEDCPGQGTPFNGTLELSIALTQNAPAFVEQRVKLTMNVTKSPPAPNAQARTYGPFTANVTYTPGYFDLFNVRTDQRIVQVSPDETARFTVRIENFSNDETRFRIDPEQTGGPAATARADPGSLTVVPQASGNTTVLVSLEDGSGSLVDETVSVRVHITANSTTMAEVEGSTSEQSLQVQFRRASADPRDAPVVGIAGTLAAVVAGFALRRRRYL